MTTTAAEETTTTTTTTIQSIEYNNVYVNIILESCPNGLVFSPLYPIGKEGGVGPLLVKQYCLG